MPRISVIIPTYNREKLVREAIQSVLRQTYTYFELIVVDDGSTDNTKAVVNSFQDPRVRYEYQAKRGTSAARNTGINCSTTEYLAFLDSDDLYLETALEKSVSALDSHPEAGFSHGQALVMSETGEVSRTAGKSRVHARSTVIDSIDQVREMITSGPILTPTVMARRSCIEKIDGFSEDLWFAQDYHFFVRLAMKCPSFYIAEPLIYRRIHRDMVSIITRPGKEKAFPLILEAVFGDPAISPRYMNLWGEAHSYFYSNWMARSVYRYNKKLARQYLRKSVRFYPKVIFQRRVLKILYLYLLSLTPDRWRLAIRDLKRRWQKKPK